MHCRRFYEINKHLLQIQQRKCYSCEEILHIDNFYWRKTRSSDKNLSTVCKKCEKIKNEEKYRKKNPITEYYSIILENKELVIQNRRKCPKCKFIFDLNFFRSVRTNNRNIKTNCFNCRRSRNKQDKNDIKNSRLRKIYNISLEDYNELEKEQNYRCVICLKNKTKNKNKSLVVDHDHQTGLVRGLLCNNCNRSIGYAQDSICILKRMIEYISKHSDIAYERGLYGNS